MSIGCHIGVSPVCLILTEHSGLLYFTFLQAHTFSGHVVWAIGLLGVRVGVCSLNLEDYVWGVLIALSSFIAWNKSWEEFLSIPERHFGMGDTDTVVRAPGVKIRGTVPCLNARAGRYLKSVNRRDDFTENA